MSEGAAVANKACETRSADRGRLMFEHVDRHGRTQLLPLSLETQKFFANIILGYPDAPRAGEEFLEPGEEKPRIGAQTFTAREWQVFDLLVSGLSSKQIAHKLNISSRTVEIHRANLIRKAGARNTASLIRAAFMAA
jgi:two-component system response regulator FixJ